MRPTHLLLATLAFACLAPSATADDCSPIMCLEMEPIFEEEEPEGDPAPSHELIPSDPNEPLLTAGGECEGGSWTLACTTSDCAYITIGWQCEGDSVCFVWTYDRCTKGVNPLGLVNYVDEKTLVDIP